MANRSEYHRGWRAERRESDPHYREKRNKYQRAARAAHPERYAEYSRKARAKEYGLTLEEFDSALDGPCAICGGTATHRDHSHTTGQFRGPLCENCNRGLGMFKDNPDLLLSAAAYIVASEDNTNVPTVK